LAGKDERSFTAIFSQPGKWVARRDSSLSPEPDDLYRTRQVYFCGTTRSAEGLDGEGVWRRRRRSGIAIDRLKDDDSSHELPE
jgi:hypothetical protein